MTLWRNLVVALVAAFALAACSSSSDNNAAMDETPPPVVDTTVDDALAAIRAAPTAEEAQAAYDAVKDDVTAAEGETLQAAVDARIMAIDAADRANMQRMALAAAAGAIDTSDLSTQEAVDAARTAIATLRGALAAAADVDDTSMYEGVLNSAVAAVDAAQGGIDTATRRTNQMTALSDASDDLQAALAALSGSTPTQAQLDAANEALGALNTAIMAGADLTEDEKAPYEHEAGNAAAPISTAQAAFDKAEDEAENTANAAMAVTAAKLYAGISAQMGTGDGTTFAATDRDAAYNAAETAILVSIGDGTNTPAVPASGLHTLSEDGDTMVADNHGWDAKRYIDPAGGDSVEAVVYSNVEDPTRGDPFNEEYTLLTTATTGVLVGELAVTGDVAGATSRVAFTGVTRTAGTETFELPDPNDLTQTRIRIPGSYHGVSGNYYCTPATPANGCSAAVATEGFTVSSGDTWAFAPSSATARVMESADVDYASYGWWLFKEANDGDFTASAFVDERGTVPDAINLNTLNGTAKYVGGAAGKYALSSSTGGMNDAGHFTARATLEANFTTNDGTDTTTNAITGTLDMFIGADGQSRNWEVKLNGSPITDTGGIGEAGDTTGDNAPTVWTIGDDAADAAGEWTGNLRNNGTDGVPQVATGTFYSEFGRSGKMVGAFGANKQ